MRQTHEYQYDVFISHASDDAGKVAPYVRRLQDEKLKVWVDDPNKFDLPYGETGQQIEPTDDLYDSISENARRSRCVLVFWSKVSVGRIYDRDDWVHHEATYGSMAKKLFQLQIEDVDLSQLPEWCRKWGISKFTREQHDLSHDKKSKHRVFTRLLNKLRVFDQQKISDAKENIIIAQNFINRQQANFRQEFKFPNFLYYLVDRKLQRDAIRAKIEHEMSTDFSSPIVFTLAGHVDQEHEKFVQVYRDDTIERAIKVNSAHNRAGDYPHIHPLRPDWPSNAVSIDGIASNALRKFKDEQLRQGHRLEPPSFFNRLFRTLSGRVDAPVTNDPDQLDAVSPIVSEFVSYVSSVPAISTFVYNFHSHSWQPNFLPLLQEWITLWIRSFGKTKGNLPILLVLFHFDDEDVARGFATDNAPEQDMLMAKNLAELNGAFSQNSAVCILDRLQSINRTHAHQWATGEVDEFLRERSNVEQAWQIDPADLAAKVRLEFPAIDTKFTMKEIESVLEAAVKKTLGNV